MRESRGHLIGSAPEIVAAHGLIGDRFPLSRRVEIMINEDIESALREMGERRILLPDVGGISLSYGPHLLLRGVEMWDVFPSSIGVGPIEDFVPDDLAPYWDPSRAEARPIHLGALACALDHANANTHWAEGGFYTLLVDNRIHLRGKVFSTGKGPYS